MNDERFEQRLRDQPWRPIPSTWRAEILSVASAAAPARPERNPDPVAPWWRPWLWPCPAAWAGLAAAWVLILALNHLTPGPTSTLAVSSGLHGFDFQAALAMHRLLETEQIEPRQTQEPEPPQPGPRQRPRSGRVLPQRILHV